MTNGRLPTCLLLCPRKSIQRGTCSRATLAPSGSPCRWEINVSSYLAIALFLLVPLLRQLATALPFGPRYKMYVGSVTGAMNERVMAAVEDGSVRPVVDAQSPLPFTQEGVTRAFVQQEQRIGHGKIVVKISD